MEEKDRFEASFARAVAIIGAAVIPPGLLVSGLIAGWRGLAGAFVGFAVASLHTLVVIKVLKWALRQPPGLIPAILMGSYFARILLLAGILIGLSYVKALNTIAMLTCFLVLYTAHTLAEVALAWRSFGATLKPPVSGGDSERL